MDFEMDRFPWLSGIALSALLGMVFFPIENLPVYVTEMLMFAVLGLELCGAYRRGKPFVAFITVMLWVLAQVLIWSGGASLHFWAILLLQVGAGGFYFSDLKPLVRVRGSDFAYAGLYVIAMFAVSNLVINMLAFWPALWALAVLLTCLGYLLPRHGYATTTLLTPAGILLGLAVATTIGGTGLIIA